jgi:hypothetical protein
MASLAEDIRERLPEHLREACTPAGIMWSVYGLSPGESHCPECGTVVELHHYRAFPNPHTCQGRNGDKVCGRPWPRRCAAKGCPRMVQPIKVEQYRGAFSWDEPPPHCGPCSVESVREHREKVLVRGRRGNPWGLPARIRTEASTRYKAWPWRKPLDDAARLWLASNLGRDAGHDPVLYVYGAGPGSGKSTGAARIVILAVSDGKARSLVWVREAELFLILSSRGDAGPREELLRRLYDAELLVVDEVFKGEGSSYLTRDGVLTRVGEQLRDCWHVRFEDGRPTIFTSNTWCGDKANSLWARLFGDPLASRFYGAARVIECNGPDMR